MKLVLASSSTYRQSILKKLQVPFTSIPANIDESAHKNETIPQQVARLARDKALAVSATTQGESSYIIGSDQLASFNQQALGKPGNFENAKRQLQMVSGHTVRFYTGLCILRCQDKQMQQQVEIFDVKFKPLTEKMISTYLNIEKPYDCAGSFKSEGLGISLFESLNGRDPNALIGLPLIALIELFSAMSVDLFDYMQA